MKKEKDLFKELVEQFNQKIGYEYPIGGFMDLAQDLWKEYLVKVIGFSGGEFSIGPCVGLLEDCPNCVEFCKAGHCDWCCGSRKVTRKVASVIRD